ncbi:MAG: O-GlcNAc transferase, partial [Phycisphaerae bacterium]|nr:O-GlcNAc transferase [Phycisphaerae bacterium]
MTRIRTFDSWKSILTLLALTLIAYLPLTHAGFIWDDDHHVYANSLLHSLGGLWRMWTQRTALPQYYPLTHTVFWIEYHLWGNNPLGYHLINVVIHAANAVLVWRILKSLKIEAAWLAALIFALHPVNVETVAWVSERKNTLSGLFYLLSLICYLRT